MFKWFSLFCGAIFLAACTSQSADSFVGKEYKLQNAPDNAEITIGFAAKETRFFGVAAINNYFGSYQLNGGKITLEPAGSTMMAGPEELMKAEQDYLHFLPTVVSYKLNGKFLTIVGENDKELVFEEIGDVKEE